MSPINKLKPPKLGGIKKELARSIVRNFEKCNNLYYLEIVSFINCTTSGKCTPGQKLDFKIKKYIRLYNVQTKFYVYKESTWKVR